jgi:hypothetical protein
MWTFILKLVLSSGLTFLAWKVATAFGPRYGPIGLLAVSVVWGITFARYIIESFSAIKYWAKHSVSMRWSGKFYMFEERQIRFFVVDDAIWIPLRDLEKLMEPSFHERELRLLGAAHGQIPEHEEIGLSEDGLLKLLQSRTEHRRASSKMIRFRNWLQNNALPNVRRFPESASNRN